MREATLEAVTSGGRFLRKGELDTIDNKAVSLVGVVTVQATRLENRAWDKSFDFMKGVLKRAHR